MNGVPAHDGRDETVEQRSDRNWSELLQELRVMQVGTQILTGFLLTLPFQARFDSLDGFQVAVYLILVALAVTTTGLMVAPVAVHRYWFHRRRKPELVEFANRVSRWGIAVLALTVAGTVLLIVDVVVGRGPAIAASSVVLVALAAVWFALPATVGRRSMR